MAIANCYLSSLARLILLTLGANKDGVTKKMKRRFFTLAIFAALLVGCAASAMRFGPPQTANASIGQSHVKPLTVTGPCYKSGGGDCSTTFHFVHDSATLTVASDCGTGVGCTFTTDVTFSGNAEFANTKYDCHAHGTDSGSDGVIFNSGNISGSDVEFVFRNETPHTITSGTQFTIYYLCAGA